MSFFFVWYENLIAQFVGINSPKTDIGFMILCDLEHELNNGLAAKYAVKPFGFR